MAAKEDSPFQACKFDDDEPLPPVQDPSVEVAEGVCSMIDSPFASGLITLGLMEQLSQSIVAGSKPPPSNTEQAPAQATAGRPAAAAADAAGGGADVATAAKAPGPRLQGVASILESPFASTCITEEIKQLQLQPDATKASDKAQAA